MELQDVVSRLDKLETRFDERWDSHDKRSEQRWSTMREQLHELVMSANVVDKLPCKMHENQMKAMWAVLLIQLAAVVGVFFK